MPHLSSNGLVRVGTVQELKDKGCIVVRGGEYPIAVFYNGGKVLAVDNRCPHMGFPLSKGTVRDGILTCHWHHARFDLSSGCTFDLWADDVPANPVEVRDGEVWVSTRHGTPADPDYWRRRLLEGMAQNISLVTAKAVIRMQREGIDYREIVREGALWGIQHRDGWGPGLTILTAMANLVPSLPAEQQFHALYHGLSNVADDCAGQTPRRERYPLTGSKTDHETLKRWLRDWTRVRHRDGAERTLLTAIAGGASQADLADMMLTAATDRFYADGGHTLDFVNKTFELLDLIGWEHAQQVLPAVVRQMVMSRGGEESSPWRHPTDLVAMLREAFGQMPRWFEEGRGKAWNDEPGLAEAMLSDDPARIVEALGSAIRAGALPVQLSKSLCYAAALRIARFGTANEFGDWVTALHTFTYCNGIHQGLKRLDGDGWERRLDPVRGVFHGAISVYLDRFLNVPPAPLPGERAGLDDEPTDAEALRQKLLQTLDMQQRVNAAGKVVARYLSLGHPVDELIGTLAEGVLREDADFHTFQMLEAAVRQMREWGELSPQGRNILIALARYMAAHSPTQRAAHQTARIALRLEHGKALYEEEEEISEKLPEPQTHGGV